MSDSQWERLPEDTKEMCDRDLFDKLGRPDSRGPCGNKAVWIKRSTCGCGSVCLNIRHCQKHQDVHLAEKKHVEEWGKKNVVEINGLPPGIVGFRRR